MEPPDWRGMALSEVPRPERADRVDLAGHVSVGQTACCCEVSLLGGFGVLARCAAVLAGGGYTAVQPPSMTRTWPVM